MLRIAVVLTTLLLLTAGATRHGAAQEILAVRFSAVEPDHHAFGGKDLVLINIRIDTSEMAIGGVVPAGERIGELVARTDAPRGAAAGWLDSARAAYEADLSASIAAADSGLALAPGNPLLLQARARALFKAEARGDAFETYRQLMDTLSAGAPDTVVVIDPNFAESYGKLGALYLDRVEYERAADYLTRAAEAGRTLNAPAGFVAAQLSHLTEAYTELGEPDIARYFGRETLRVDPRNQYVLPYLERLGPGANGILACRTAGDGLPDAGIYSLFANRDREIGPVRGEQLMCASPIDDGEKGLVPCLRIGQVHIGQPREEVLRRLSPVYREVAGPDGAPAFIHLVFANQETGAVAYYVIQYEAVGGREVVHTLQITGAPPPLQFSFSCLGLGSHADAVIRQLGVPGSIEPFTDHTNDTEGEIWNYGTAPVSIEMADDRVYSIRIFRPPDADPQVIELTVLNR